MVTVWLSSEAKDQLEEMDEEEANVVKALEIIRDSPLTNNHTKYIHHPEYGDIYRYKLKSGVADHRIFFEIIEQEDGIEIEVVSILHRDRAYEFK